MLYSKNINGFYSFGEREGDKKRWNRIWGEVKLFYRILVDAYYVFVKTCRILKHID